MVTRCLAWCNKSTGFDDNGYNGGSEPFAVFNNTAFNNGCNTRSHVWFRWFNEIPVVVLLAVILLVVLKPF